ncbi:hypothetical protein QJS04_geneDACA009618 [Acorus gramineus]|uniref:Protein HEAT INTOLERANT 4-like n=1 Tax=Acorus gramineus TaxID=55184 RepID=A0AAV9BD52_ACOGR|nr:hypothetical protein QJS04_geneDACA009618 [Acorus gramineus]
MKRPRKGAASASLPQAKAGEAPNKGRKRKSPKSHVEPEVLPDKRNLEDLWKKAFPVGTEWDQLDDVYNVKWDFTNLENAFEEGGELYEKKVYLFGCTEPQLVNWKDGQKVMCIPVVVAVVSPFPPSDKVGLKSIQREKEEIIPMKKMKMTWAPYIPEENRYLLQSQVERLKSNIFTMTCTQRRAALKHLKLERIKEYEYCLPYFYQPLKEDELEQDMIVTIVYPMEPPVICEFDWELDDLEEFTDDMITNEVLPEDQKNAFKEFVKGQVRESKKKQREVKEARKKAIKEMDEATKTALENMRFYKFYPVQTPDTPDISDVKVY